MYLARVVAVAGCVLFLPACLASDTDGAGAGADADADVDGHVSAAASGDFQGWDEDSMDLIPRDSEEYFDLLRTDYKYRLMNDSIDYNIEILVNPCREFVQTGGRGVECCFDTGRVACQHHPEDVQAGSDLQIAYFSNSHIVSCEGTVFARDPNCGTYIELHRAGVGVSTEDSNRVVADIRLQEEFVSGFRTANIPTHRLCYGPHELWWVVRTRSGPYVQWKQPFYVTQPSCPQPPGLVFTTTLPPTQVPGILMDFQYEAEMKRKKLGIGGTV